mgnify:CR=1 FL=1
MRHKRKVLQFLEDNACMINSLMSKKEQIAFHGDVVSIITKEIKKQIMESKEISHFKEESEGN